MLRDYYVRGKYRDVILPMTLLRRLDALLEDTEQTDETGEQENYRMTTLTLDDELAQQLAALAAAQNKTLDELATETLKQLVRSAPDMPPGATPQTLADELMPFLQQIWAEQAAETTSLEPYPAPGTFGDIYEERFSQYWDEEHAVGNKGKTSC